MPLPKNDPYARVVDSLDELVEAHKNPAVEVAFYPKLDTGADMLDIFEQILTKDQSFNCYIAQLLTGDPQTKYYFYGFDGDFYYCGPSLEDWNRVFMDYVQSCVNISALEVEAFIVWTKQEIDKHCALLKTLRVQQGDYCDQVMYGSLRASQAGAEVALGEVLDFHQDIQNYTMMKYYIGPSTEFAPRKLLNPRNAWRSSKPRCYEKIKHKLYTLDGQGVCLHKGKHMPGVKSYHRAPEGLNSPYIRGFLTCWLNWQLPDKWL